MERRRKRQTTKTRDLRRRAMDRRQKMKMISCMTRMAGMMQTRQQRRDKQMQTRQKRRMDRRRQWQWKITS